MASSLRKPDWDLDLAIGSRGESLVESIFTGGKRLEVKTDIRALETGNLFLEYEALSSQGHWYASGVSSTKADYYVFVLGELVLAVAVGVLQQYVRDCQMNNRNLKEMRRGTHPTKGVVLPIRELWELFLDTEKDGEFDW